jgi:hypothetical protein
MTMKCQHKFELARIVNESNVSGTNCDASLMKPVAYTICPKCGEVRRSEVKYETK